MRHKYLPLLSFAIFSLTVHADYRQDDFADEDNDFVAQMPQRNVPSNQQNMEPRHHIQPCNSPTPPAMIVLAWEAEPFVTADYLYWTARQENMCYAIERQAMNFGLGQVEQVLKKSKVLTPHWKYASGFRVGTGLNFKHDGWDTYLNYTWFHPQKVKDHKSAVVSQNPPIEGGLSTAWSTPLNGPTTFLMDEASESWKFRYDDINWELGRNFFISRYLTLRPFGGLKTTWQQQRQRISYNENLSAGIVIRDFSIINHVHFWGIGIRAGLNSAWYLYKKYLSIVGDIAFSGLWSRIKTSQRQPQSFRFAGMTRTGTTLHTTDNFHTIKPVIEWALGMQWDAWIHHNRMKFALRAAWEEQIWFDQNELPEFQLAQYYKARGGNLSIEGLSVRARFDF